MIDCLHWVENTLVASSTYSSYFYGSNSDSQSSNQSATNLAGTTIGSSSNFASYTFNQQQDFVSGGLDPLKSTHFYGYSESHASGVTQRVQNNGESTYNSAIGSTYSTLDSIWWSGVESGYFTGYQSIHANGNSYGITHFITGTFPSTGFSDITDGGPFNTDGVSTSYGSATSTLYSYYNDTTTSIALTITGSTTYSTTVDDEVISGSDGTTYWQDTTYTTTNASTTQGTVSGMTRTQLTDSPIFLTNGIAITILVPEATDWLWVADTANTTLSDSYYVIDDFLSECLSETTIYPYITESIVIPAVVNSTGPQLTWFYTLTGRSFGSQTIDDPWPTSAESTGYNQSSLPMDSFTLSFDCQYLSSTTRNYPSVTSTVTNYVDYASQTTVDYLYGDTTLSSFSIYRDTDGNYQSVLITYLTPTSTGTFANTAPASYVMSSSRFTSASSSEVGTDNVTRVFNDQGSSGLAAGSTYHRTGQSNISIGFILPSSYRQYPDAGSCFQIQPYLAKTDPFYLGVSANSTMPYSLFQNKAENTASAFYVVYYSNLGIGTNETLTGIDPDQTRFIFSWNSSDTFTFTTVAVSDTDSSFSSSFTAIAAGIDPADVTTFITDPRSKSGFIYAGGEPHPGERETLLVQADIGGTVYETITPIVIDPTTFVSGAMRIAYKAESTGVTGGPYFAQIYTLHALT